MGEWLKEYGETIYGTRGGIITPRDWGVTTQKGNKLYVHILELDDKGLFLPLEMKQIKSAKLYNSDKKINISKNTGGITLNLPEVPVSIDYIVELELKN